MKKMILVGLMLVVLLTALLQMPTVYAAEQETGTECLHNYAATVTPPTCTEQGYTTHTCACGESYVDSYIAAKGHTFGAWTQVKAPTCGAEGQDMRTCTVCGAANYRDTRISGDVNQILVSDPLPSDYFAGKKLLTIGDSITGGVGLSNPSQEYYGKLVSDALGMTAINKGSSGSGYCSGGAMATNKTLTQANVKNADIITIMLGINDWDWAVKEGYWNGKPGYYDEDQTYYQLGDFECTDTSTFYGALHQWCQEIVRLQQLEGFEDKQFIVITPLITSWNVSMGSAKNWDQSKLNVHGHTLRQYCTAIMEVCAAYGIPVFDANMFSGIYYNSPEDNNVGETGGDGVHINANGHALLAESLIEFLLENYAYEQRTVSDGGHSYDAVVTPPTCTEQGYTIHSCSTCVYSYVDAYVAAKGHTYKNGICTVCGISVLDLDYTHAEPENQGIANAIERAYHLTDVEWTPVADMPGVKKINGEFTVITFEAGVTYRGIPYSGVIATDTYVGLNVSLESFLTALKNENSVLYTENLFSTNPKSATYYGTVCSKFAQYVLDVPGSFNTNNVANIPGMDTIAMPGEFTVDQIKLGDVILHTVNHTSVCTDIMYDAEGNVAFIEISEAVLPQVRRLLWSPEEFYEHFAGYRLCRYQFAQDVPAAERISVEADYALMPRFGDKYNYKVSSTKGVVDVLESGYSKAIVLRDGAVVSEIALNGASSFTFDRSVPGYMEMYLEKADGTRSASVYACVVKSSVTVTDTASFLSGKLSVSFEGSSGTPLYVQVGSGQSVFCSVEDALNDAATVTFRPALVSGETIRVRVAYQNEYGIYLSSWVSFNVDYNQGTGPNPSSDKLLSQAIYWDGYNITPSNHRPTIQEEKKGYWSYTMIPVEENTTYYSWGATRMWYLDATGKAISTYNAYKDSAVPCYFTTPAGSAYVSIAYSPNLLNQGEEKIEKISSDYEGGKDEEEIVPANPSTDPYLSQGEYWDGYTLTPSSSVPIIQADKPNYWTYAMVPVEANTTYYSVGANRMWFFDVDKKPISTYNAITGGEIQFQFTTPENACYVSITYASSVVEKGMECLQKVVPAHTHIYLTAITPPTCTEQGYTTHTCACGDSYVDSYIAAKGHSYENGICTVCGEKDPAHIAYGDLDDNGVINTTDVVLLRRFIAGGYGVEIPEKAADLNSDGILNTTDVVLLRRYIAGGYDVVLPGAA